MSGRELPPGHRVRVFGTEAEWLAGAVQAVSEAVTGAGPAPRLVLAGGETPVPVYESLARSASPGESPWDRVRFTWSDERSVPPSDPDSNFGMARRTLLDPLGVPRDHLLRIRGEDPPDRAAEKLHRELVVWSQRVPLFDVVLLGLGEDGHVASLFPAPSWPDFGARLAAAARHPSGQNRVTLTPAALRTARRILFLVAGEVKAPAVARTLQAESPSPEVPARLVVGGEGAEWILDAAAAAELPEAWWEGTAG